MLKALVPVDGSENSLRAVTHLDVSVVQCERAASILCDII